MWKYRTQTQQNASQPIVLSLKTLHHQKWRLPCCLPLACPLSGWDLLTSQSHTWMKRLNLSEHGLSLDFSRLLVQFKSFLAWSWAQFQLENSCTVLLRQTQGSIKSYSQNLWGEQHNFGREIHPVGTITLLPQPHFPFCLLHSLEDEIGIKQLPIWVTLAFGGDGQLTRVNAHFSVLWIWPKV